ncbi:MAG: Unknown protein [uncultured Sulfurovum sp.]|uniref:Uncharacterized protein n=1 Tax=uncultured Sulfurovum sp. TaxID=269237 RepID=A0A6S6UHB2_9BACT|nr:MAG: Unknown protein [uncultured Sulfurovum sp.]
MKFLVTKELGQNKLLRLQVLWLTVALVFFLVTDLIVHHFKMGLTPTLALEYILGNEEAFVEPILLSVLLEGIHMDLFFSMITLTLLVIIFIRVNNNQKTKFIHFTFLSAIFTPISLLLAYFYAEIFIMFWIGFFMFWHLCAFYFAIIILRKL